MAGDAKPRARRLAPEHRFLLFVLGATTFFDGYDRGIISLALKQIRASFDLTQGTASVWLTFLYLGALPALVLTRRADRSGRRRLLIVCVTGYTIATGLTAASPTIGTFVVCQFAARLFLNAEAAIVWTMAAEELPADARGLGFGILGMASALGVGFGAIVFGGILDPLGVSWRVLYLIGLPPLVIVATLRRRLPESGRFVAAQAAGRLSDRWHDIFHRAYRRPLLLVLSTAFLFQLTTQATVFSLDFLQTDRHLSATAANFMLVGAGLPGIPIMVIAGSLSDRLGRRAVGCAFGAISLLGAAGFFWLPGGIPVLLPCLMLVTVGGLGSWPVLSSYAAELFPTALRGQSSAWSTVAKVCGDGASLAIGGALLHFTGSLPPTVTILAIGPLIAMVIVVTKFPDTHGLELEVTSGEDAAAVASASDDAGFVLEDGAVPAQGGDVPLIEPEPLP